MLKTPSTAFTFKAPTVVLYANVEFDTLFLFLLFNLRSLRDDSPLCLLFHRECRRTVCATTATTRKRTAKVCALL